MKKCSCLFGVALATSSLPCIIGCNTPAPVVNAETARQSVVKVDLAKQIAQNEATRINAKVEEFLNAANFSEAQKFCVEYALSGNSEADKEIGRLRLLLLEKIWNCRWAKTKLAMESKFVEYQKADIVAAAVVGMEYFSRLSDVLIPVVKIPYWMDVADKDLPVAIDSKRNKINGAYKVLLGSYGQQLALLRTKLEERDFRLECDRLLGEVRAALQKQDFVSARSLLWGRNKNIAERLQPTMLAFRIGVLNTFVNPLHLVCIVDDINNTVNGLMKAGKFDEALKFLDAYAVEGTENKLLEELLEVVKKEYGETYLVGEKELSAFFRIHAEELQMLLDARVGAWKHPADGSLEKALEALAKGMKDEVLDEGAIKSYISNIRKSIVARNVTTAALKDRLAKLKRERKIKDSAVSSTKLEESVEKVKAQKRVVVKLQATGKIDFAGKIYAAERAAIMAAERASEASKRIADAEDAKVELAEAETAKAKALTKSEAVEAKMVVAEKISKALSTAESAVGAKAIVEQESRKGLLLAEYARNMRKIEASTNSWDGVDKQVVLSAAIILEHYPIVEFATESGADVSCASPFVNDSPFVLAIKGGHRKMLAYLIENKAASNLERDGMVAMKQAILMNRADLVDLVYEVGFAPSSAQNEELMNFVCANGRDQVFFKLLGEKGMKPKYDDYVSAAKAGNVPIVRWFVEKKFYSVNDEKVRSVAVGPAKDYLIERGMQKEVVANPMPHKAAK